VGVEDPPQRDETAASKAAAAGFAAGPDRRAAGTAARGAAARRGSPRALLCAGVLLLACGAMAGAWLLRETASLVALRDRAPLYVTLSDGGIRNAYTPRVTNRGPAAELRVDLEGPPQLRMSASGGAPGDPGSPLRLGAAARAVTEVRVLVTAPPDARIPRSAPVSFRATDASGRVLATAGSVFLSPAHP